MRKLLAVATISLFTLGMALPAMAEDSDFTPPDEQSQSQDWYQQQVDAQAGQCQSEFQAIQDSSQEEAQLTSIDNASDPGSMAANGDADLYGQALQAEFQNNVIREAALSPSE